jgi:hypothetical protein
MTTAEHRVLSTVDEGGIAVRFVPQAGLVATSLLHRGEERLGQRGGLEAYVAERKTMGIPLLYPWANRLEGMRLDVAGREAMAEHVARLAREVGGSVVAEGRRITHVAVKVRTASFWTRTKISKLPAPTTDLELVAARAVEVLDRFGELRPVRLLGVRVVLDEPT